MHISQWNPRVVLWAKVQGIDLKLLERGDNGDLYRPDGTTPWTVLFSQWVQRKWRDFHCLCHGTPERGECCAGGPDTQRRFDEWLDGQCKD